MEAYSFSCKSFAADNIRPPGSDIKLPFTELPVHRLGRRNSPAQRRKWRPESQSVGSDGLFRIDAQQHAASRRSHFFQGYKCEGELIE